jgi:hypothetical protein
MSQQNMQQYLQNLANLAFPANKEQIVRYVRNSGAPQYVVSYLQNNLSSGKYSNVQQVTSNLLRWW